MSAKFFEKYSIEEISKRTKISPISLRFIKNKEYEKIPRVKFLGFIKIMQREFKEDLSYLIEEYDLATNQKPTQKPQQETKKTPPPKKEKNIIYLLAVILLIITGAVIYLTQNSNKISTPQTNQTVANLNIEQNISVENNISQNPNTFATKTSQNTTAVTANIPQNNTSNPKVVVKPSIPKNITIIPNEKVWFRALNLDTNKTYEYLTSHTKTLPGSNYYIKFGHGNVTIEYGNTTITPNTKKIIRLYFHNGKYEYVKKGFKP
jgi:cytoskeletal protein RodZ